MKTFVFVHVAKTAGTSLINAVSKIVLPGSVRGFYEATPVSFNGLAFVSSHGRFRTLDAVPGEKVFLTAIRRPVDRLVSVYRFWRSITKEEAVERGYSHVLKVKEQTFEQFIMARDEPYWQQLNNEMTRTFCDASGNLTETNFSQAVENINRCAFIFQTERLDQDIRHFYELVGSSQRHEPRAANVTDSNHASTPARYDQAGSVNLNDLSAEGRAVLAELTSFDQKFYSAAVAMAEDKRLNPAADLECMSIARPLIGRGEVVLPTKSASFATIMGRGWAPSENIVWSVGGASALKLRVREGTSRPTKVVIKLNACILPNRNFMVVNIAVDKQSKKTILFAQQNVAFEAISLWDRKIDMICTAPHSATVELALASNVPEAEIHTINFETCSAASPELLGWNSDNRPLGIRLESLTLV